MDTYLEEEVRAESLVRNRPAFYRFLELAALESGRIVSFNSISKEIGVAHTTVSSYFEVLEDCLVVERIDPSHFKTLYACRDLLGDDYFLEVADKWHMTKEKLSHPSKKSTRPSTVR